ncbi:MAG TPA: hypothetical protein VJZ71_21575 [Phycisphaerae bacterium]|nr:hypothetical protein [Phycisphaerae bacterium]
MVIFWPLSLFVLGGLNCDQTMINTVELNPSKSATINDFEEDCDCSGAPCPLFPSVTNGPAKVGYARNYDAGSGLFDCSWWWAEVYRGVIQFDVASLGAPADRITGATLEFDLSTIYDDPIFADNCPNDLLSSIWIVNEPWAPKLTLAADFMTGNTSKPNCIVNHHSVDASQVVRDWISGARPNFGFMFIGWDESTPANDEVTYVTTVTNVKLKVLYTVPAMP